MLNLAGTTRLFLLAAAANVWTLVAVLAAACIVQFALGELPCRLCLLQRIGLMLCALGPLHILLAARNGTVRQQDIAIGCGMAIVAALLGASVSARQVLLHIMPGDAGYGAPALGLHLYTWCLVAFICQIAASAGMLLASGFLDGQPARFAGLTKVTAAGLGCIVALNLVLVFAEAGLHWDIPETPVKYQLFG